MRHGRRPERGALLVLRRDDRARSARARAGGSAGCGLRLFAMRDLASWSGVVMMMLGEIGAVLLVALIVGMARRYSVSGPPSTGSSGSQPSEPTSSQSPATSSAASSPATSLLALPFVALVLAVLFGIPIVFVYLGAREAWRDHVKRATFEPVPAVVLQSTIEARRLDRRSRAYAPRVRYRYSVGGQTYIGHQVTPLDEAYSESWANGLAGQFHRGDEVTAYVDPERPGDSFLVQRISWLPYLFIGSGVAFPGVLMLLFRQGKARSTASS
jgi:hypothetical protein